jgi:hypothetical protein
MKQTKKSLLLTLAAAIMMQPSTATALESRYDTSSQCKSRGQIIQISGLKYLCQKRYVPIGAVSTPSFVLVKISSVKIQKRPIGNVQTTTTTTAVPTTTSTTTTILQRKYLISSTYEVVDSNRIKISWNQIPDVREYRICIDNECNGADSQKIWTTLNSSLDSIIVNLPRGQTKRYFVHALMLPNAMQFDDLDTRTCCYGTKWANSKWLQATNQ